MAGYKNLSEWHPVERRSEITHLTKELLAMSDDGHIYTALDMAHRLVYLLEKSREERQEKLVEGVV